MVSSIVKMGNNATAFKAREALIVYFLVLGLIVALGSLCNISECQIASCGQARASKPCQPRTERLLIRRDCAWKFDATLGWQSE
jgi:hypothetical protein